MKLEEKRRQFEEEKKTKLKEWNEVCILPYLWEEDLRLFCVSEKEDLTQLAEASKQRPPNVLITLDGR